MAETLAGASYVSDGVVELEGSGSRQFILPELMLEQVRIQVETARNNYRRGLGLD